MALVNTLDATDDLLLCIMCRHVATEATVHSSKGYREKVPGHRMHELQYELCRVCGRGH
jgi:hypothetical protein